MSPTGTDARMGGFTLLELLVVLVIVGLALTLVPPEMIRVTDAQALKADTRKVLGMLRFAHTRAITSSAPVSLSIDAAARRIIISGSAETGMLAPATSVRVAGAAGEQPQTPTILFFPDGRSSGGTILLSNSRDGYAINVDWLTGDAGVVRP